MTLIGSALGWPISAFLSSSEPQFVLFLSWLAIFIGAVNILFVADVPHDGDDD